MNLTYIPLSIWDLVFASVLILLNGWLSIILRLRLEKPLFISALRMIIQLGLIGFILKFIFQLNYLPLTLAWAMLMIAMAGYEVRARQTTKLSGFWSYGLGASILFVSGLLSALMATALFIQPTPWYDARYFLPILGMILGNAMTGIALGLDRFFNNVIDQKGAIEARLSLGSTKTEAMRPQMRTALRAGMMPIINIMSASGLVSLPGMMTGQIISGADPVEAAKYQILIIMLIGGATVLGTLLGVGGAMLLVSDDRHRLRLDRLERRE